MKKIIRGLKSRPRRRKRRYYNKKTLVFYISMGLAHVATMSYMYMEYESSGVAKQSLILDGVAISNFLTGTLIVVLGTMFIIELRRILKTTSENLDATDIAIEETRKNGEYLKTITGQTEDTSEVK